MIDLVQIGENQLDKHNKYGIQYKPSSTFWGLGIEKELYFEFEKHKEISVNDFMENHDKERYSIDYYSNYDKEILPEAFRLIFKELGPSVLSIPVLMNSHSFTKTDIFNNSKTLYTQTRESNPNFSGYTLQEYLELKDKYFEQTNPTWIFDGDTIEFISTSFYNAKLSDILDEVDLNTNIFIEKFNSQIFDENTQLTTYGKIKVMEQNHPFATYLTNYGKIGMFNNGTIHFNLTLPTKLDKNSQIFNKEKFISVHKKAIKMIQWFEPLILAVYGSPDPFHILKSDVKHLEKFNFSACSQRNAMSRYISIGTYNTDLMESGKILTKNINELVMNTLDYWWFNRFHASSAYTKLDQIGLDINFNKHWNHGIEIRFLDYISDKKLLQECCEFIVYLMDLSLECKTDIQNPIISKEFNDLVYNVMCTGINYSIDNNLIKIYESICSINISKSNIVDIYYEILSKLKQKFNKEFIESINSNHLYKNTFKINKLIIPTGIFSSLVLDTQYIYVKPSIIIENKKKLDEINNLDKQINYINEQINNFDCVKKYIQIDQSDTSNTSNSSDNLYETNTSDISDNLDNLDYLDQINLDNFIKKNAKIGSKKNDEKLNCCLVM